MSRSTVTLFFAAALLLSIFGMQPSFGDSQLPAPSIELRRAWAGKVVGCPECIILEFRDGDARLAYFARPEPECELGPEHIGGAFSDPDKREIALELSGAGRDYVTNCFGEGTRKDAEAVLITVNGLVAGRSTFHRDFEVLTIVGGDGFPLLEALFPEQ